MGPPKTPRPPIRTQILPLHEQLSQAFPKAFYPIKSKKRKPLAIGIDEAIREKHPDLDPNLLGWTLFLYFDGFHYLKALQSGEFRVDLDGNPVGNVTDQDAVYAANRIRNKQRKESARKKA